MRTTWKPHEKHGRLTTQSDLPDSVFAFPKQRKEPLTDARHVRNAIARLDQVTGVADADRELAFANIKKAAEHYGVELSEQSWQDVGVHPQSRAKKTSAAKKRPAKKSAAKKSGAKKSTAKKAGAKKTGAKKTVRKKSARKETARKA
jgi:hypothetical protein